MSPGLANYRGTPGIFGWWIRNPLTVLHKSHIFHSVGPTGSNTKVTLHLSLEEKKMGVRGLARVESLL